MNHIYRDIFKAVHEGKWLSIEYKNKSDKITRYWIGIRDIDVRKMQLKVDGLHLGNYEVKTLPKICIDSILSSRIVEGSYNEINKKLVEDIYINPHKYKPLFENVANMKILNYLEDCNRMDVTPYRTDFELVKKLDRESFSGEFYSLSDEQFREIVKNFQYKTIYQNEQRGNVKIQQLCINVLSIHTAKGLYVLAYRKLELDVKNKMLKPDEEITVCSEFTMEGSIESIRKYLDAEDYELLSDFENNQELIKDCIQKHNRQNISVDDMPYIIGLGMDVILDLHKEYSAIIDMYYKENVSIPIKAFFGDLISRPRRRKAYPIALINKRVNLDQLLAINNAVKYPVAYIQGPPGTGKTNTILNTICTAFFNDRTVLFTSYNNHPIDAVFDKLISIKYGNRDIPFPVIRLGNNDKVKEACEYIRNIYERTKNLKIFDKTLDKNKGDRIDRAKKLSEMLQKYEEILDLKEREETLKRMLEYNEKSGTSMQMLPFQANLMGQENNISRKIEDIGIISESEALELLTDNEHEFKKYLYYTSAKFIKRIDEPKNENLKNIVMMDNDDKQVDAFNKYLSDENNVKKFLKIFPIVVTTCISAHKIGTPKEYFDMVIMDEASQCNTAVSLVPVIRGTSLMLVGDPQQLNPVILLNSSVNERLKKKYAISDEYDYCTNSIYKTFLACDSVSDEVLLHYHYRCNKKIIDFNNKKYYNGKLKINSVSDEKEPLVYIDTKNSTTDYKNTSPTEVYEILNYANQNKDKSIGVITPFVNQKKEIERALSESNLTNVACGTVHAFQGDEKDVVLFSTAITDKTNTGTYEWLKNNKELINVATSRAKNKLIVIADSKNLERLHEKTGDDDLYELINYVKSNGSTKVTQKTAYSRALGVKPFSSAVEEAFLENLNHAMSNIWLSENKFVVRKEVGIAHVFRDNITYNDLFYSGRFDFVVYERHEKSELPVLAIELDGKEHFDNQTVKERDRKKNEICRAHNFELIRIENSYARRYNHIKEILFRYFSVNK